jgi:hypothetical protein
MAVAMLALLVPALAVLVVLTLALIVLTLGFMCLVIKQPSIFPWYYYFYFFFQLIIGGISILFCAILLKYIAERAFGFSKIWLKELLNYF